MAHYAHVDTANANIVTKVMVISNEEEAALKTEANVDAFIKSSFGDGGVWLKTSYNSNIRKNFAGVDYKWDVENDGFWPPRELFPSTFVANTTTCWYDPPQPYPYDDTANVYVYDNSSASWVVD